MSKRIVVNITSTGFQVRSSSSSLSHITYTHLINRVQALPRSREYSSPHYCPGGCRVRRQRRSSRRSLYVVCVIHPWRSTRHITYRFSGCSTRFQTFETTQSLNPSHRHEFSKLKLRRAADIGTNVLMLTSNMFTLKYFPPIPLLLDHSSGY